MSSWACSCLRTSCRPDAPNPRIDETYLRKQSRQCSDKCARQLPPKDRRCSSSSCSETNCPWPHLFRCCMYHQYTEHLRFRSCSRRRCCGRRLRRKIASHLEYLDSHGLLPSFAPAASHNSMDI